MCNSTGHEEIAIMQVHCTYIYIECVHLPLKVLGKIVNDHLACH